MALFCFFYGFWTSLRFGLLRREFLPDGSALGYLGPGGYANIGFRFLFVLNIFFPLEIYPSLFLEVGCHPPRGRSTKVVVVRCRGPPEDPTARFSGSQVPSSSGISRNPVFRAALATRICAVRTIFGTLVFDYSTQVDIIIC